MGSSIRIAGPLAIIALAILGYFLFFYPVKTLLWTHQTRLSWAGVVQNQADLKEGHISWYESGYRGEEAVLMVHGLGVEGGLEWRGNIKPIAEGHYRVLAPDLAGFGGSSAPSTPLTLASQAAELWEFLDGLKIDQADLIGRDMGADIVLQMAITAPERAQRLILVSGGLFGKAGIERERAAYLLKDPNQAPQFASLTLIELPQLPDFLYSRMADGLSSTQLPTQQLLDDAAINDPKLNAGLGKIFNTLKLIIWGKNDPVQPAREADRLHETLAGSATAAIDRTGHTPNEEHPDEFNDIAYTILKQ